MGLLGLEGGFAGIVGAGASFSNLVARDARTMSTSLEGLSLMLRLFGSLFAIGVDVGVGPSSV
jgi:hypothetical protein